MKEPKIRSKCRYVRDWPGALGKAAEQIQKPGAVGAGRTQHEIKLGPVLDDSKIIKDQVYMLLFPIELKSHRQDSAVQVEVKKGNSGDSPKDQVGD